MSWSDALRIWRERTGIRRMPTPGSAELTMVMNIFNELRNPVLSRDLEPELPKRQVVAPLQAAPAGPAPPVSKPRELTTEELIEQENRRAEAIVKRMMEEAKEAVRQRENEELRRSIVITELESREHSKDTEHETHTALKRKYCRKRKRWLIVHEPRIISFD